MSSLFDRLKSMWKDEARARGTGPAALAPMAPAPDGTHEELHSGRWPTRPGIPVETFPTALVLSEKDTCLGARGAKDIVLAATDVGAHRVELLLVESDSQALGLGLRVPTASNQYKEPYVIMEAEHGNSREDAVREIHFHLTGRLAEDEIRAVDWQGLFGSAAQKLTALRGQ